MTDERTNKRIEGQSGLGLSIVHVILHCKIGGDDILEAEKGRTLCTTPGTVSSCKGEGGHNKGGHNESR